MNPKVQLDNKQISAFCSKWKIEELSLFGSALRDDFSPESDLDFLVRFSTQASWDLWDWVVIRDELADITGRNVDLVSIKALRNPYRRKLILANREIILG